MRIHQEREKELLERSTSADANLQQMMQKMQALEQSALDRSALDVSQLDRSSSILDQLTGI